MTIVPLLGPETGFVFARRVVPSISKSPASIKSPVTGVLYAQLATSLSTTGASLTAFTVIVIMAILEVKPLLSFTT